MTPRHAVPLAALVLLVTACGQDRSVPPGAGVDPAGALTLTVHTSIQPGRHGELLTEGGVPEIRLTAPDGTVLQPRDDHADDAVFAGLDAGRYRLRAALLPCDGNCGVLDRPVTPCAGSVVVRADREVTVRWRTGSPCRIAT